MDHLGISMSIWSLILRGKVWSQHVTCASELLDLGRRELRCLYIQSSEPLAEGYSQEGLVLSTSSSHLNGKVGSNSRRMTALTEIQVLLLGDLATMEIFYLYYLGQDGEARHRSREENQKVSWQFCHAHMQGPLKGSTQWVIKAEGKSR